MQCRTDKLVGVQFANVHGQSEQKYLNMDMNTAAENTIKKANKTEWWKNNLGRKYFIRLLH